MAVQYQHHSRRDQDEWVHLWGAVLEISVLGWGEATGAPVTCIDLGYIPAHLPFCSQRVDTLAHPTGAGCCFQNREGAIPSKGENNAGSKLCCSGSVVAPRSCGQAGQQRGGMMRMCRQCLVFTSPSSLVCGGSLGWCPGCIPAAARLPARGGLPEASFSACTL